MDSKDRMRQSGLVGSKLEEAGSNVQIEDCGDGIGDRGAGAKNDEGAGVWFVPPMPGPVYVHAEACESFVGNGEIPKEYLGQPLTLEAFAANRERLAEKRLLGGGEDAALEELFGREDTEYVHLRSTSAGCYLFRVERA